MNKFNTTNKFNRDNKSGVSARVAKKNLKQDIKFLIEDRCAKAIDEAVKIKAEDFCFDERIDLDYVPEMF